MAKRSYIALSTKELESIYKDSQNDLSTLKKLQEELKHRERKAAVQLLKKVTARIEKLAKDPQTPKEPEQMSLITEKEKPMPEPTPPEVQKVSFISSIKKKLISIIQ